jgi:hypothetical protein
MEHLSYNAEKILSDLMIERKRLNLPNIERSEIVENSLIAYLAMLKNKK